MQGKCLTYDAFGYDLAISLNPAYNRFWRMLSLSTMIGQEPADPRGSEGFWAESLQAKRRPVSVVAPHKPSPLRTPHPKFTKSVSWFWPFLTDKPVFGLSRSLQFAPDLLLNGFSLVINNRSSL